METISSPSHLKFSLARDHILTWIRQGRLPAGGKLPSERELARQLAIDQRTVRRGLEDLVAAGVVVKRPRVGNFVREVAPSEMVTQVALVLPDFMLHSASRHPVAALIQQGISRVLSHDQYAISIYWYGFDRLWEDAGQNIVARGVRGALIYPPNKSAPAEIKRICDAGIHVACLDHVRPLDETEVFSVDTCSNTSSHVLLRKLVEGLLQRGHRRIMADMYCPDPSLDAVRRDLAELASQYDLGDPRRLLLEIPSDGYRWDSQAIEQALDADPRPTAIVVSDEFLATDLFRACYKRRILVPDELSVAAVFNSAPHLHPVRLTSPDWVHLRVHASELAAKHLVKLIQGQKPSVLRVKLRAEVQWTDSVRDLTIAHQHGAPTALSATL